LSAGQRVQLFGRAESELRDAAISIVSPFADSAPDARGVFYFELGKASKVRRACDGMVA
jgi:hypothetical protein